jgi:hypothetical protein
MCVRVRVCITGSCSKSRASSRTLRESARTTRSMTSPTAHPPPCTPSASSPPTATPTPTAAPRPPPTWPICSTLMGKSPSRCRGSTLRNVRRWLSIPRPSGLPSRWPLVWFAGRLALLTQGCDGSSRASAGFAEVNDGLVQLMLGAGLSADRAMFYWRTSAGLEPATAVPWWLLLLLGCGGIVCSAELSRVVATRCRHHRRRVAPRPALLWIRPPR